MSNGLSVSIIPYIENGADLPTDGSVLLAFVKNRDDGIQISPDRDRFLAVFVGGTHNVNGLPQGWTLS